MGRVHGLSHHGQRSRSQFTHKGLIYLFPVHAPAPLLGSRSKTCVVWLGRRHLLSLKTDLVITFFYQNGLKWWQTICLNINKIIIPSFNLLDSYDCYLYNVYIFNILSLARTHWLCIPVAECNMFNHIRVLKPRLWTWTASGLKVSSFHLFGVYILPTMLFLFFLVFIILLCFNSVWSRMWWNHFFVNS